MTLELEVGTVLAVVLVERSVRDGSEVFGTAMDDTDELLAMATAEEGEEEEEAAGWCWKLVDASNRTF